VIAKVQRGRGVARLLRYLFGPGQANEHSDPHVVASYPGGPELVGQGPVVPRSAELLALRILGEMVRHQRSHRGRVKVDLPAARLGLGRPDTKLPARRPMAGKSPNCWTASPS